MWYIVWGVVQFFAFLLLLMAGLFDRLIAGGFVVGLTVLPLRLKMGYT